MAEKSINYERRYFGCERAHVCGGQQGVWDRMTREEKERQMPDAKGGRKMEAKTNENTKQTEYSQRDTKTKETRKRNEDCCRIISRDGGRS